MSYYKHHLDTRGAGKEGARAEKRFVNLCKKVSFKTKSSTRYENSGKRIDFYISNEKGTVSVDVKARKAIRARTEKQDKKIWVEFKSKGIFEGWIYGKNKFIAFEILDGFIFVEKIKLRNWCEENIDMWKFVLEPEEAEGCLYVRTYKDENFGWTFDYISLVDIEIIKELSCGRIYENDGKVFCDFNGFDNSYLLD